ncbi:MAG: hypothetical protein ABUJ92_07165 [Desulfobacterales bacterium]
MEKSSDNYQAEYKKITIRTSDGSTIHGKVNIAGKKRVSDIFTSNEDLFVVMVDVSFENSFGRTMFVNKRHIVWAEPEEL